MRIEFDFSLLTGRIVAKFGSRKAFAEAMGILPAGITSRLQNKTRWQPDEIIRACKLLGVPNEKIHLYFFARKFHK